MPNHIKQLKHPVVIININDKMSCSLGDGVFIVASASNWFDFHNQSSLCPNQTVLQSLYNRFMGSHLGLLKHYVTLRGVMMTTC